MQLRDIADRRYSLKEQSILHNGGTKKQEMSVSGT